MQDIVNEQIIRINKYGGICSALTTTNEKVQKLMEFVNWKLDYGSGESARRGVVGRVEALEKDQLMSKDTMSNMKSIMDREEASIRNGKKAVCDEGLRLEGESQAMVRPFLLSYLIIAVSPHTLPLYP